MSGSADLDENLRQLRIAAINAAMRRLRYRAMPDRVDELVRLGWANTDVFRQVRKEQPRSVKIMIFLRRLNRFVPLKWIAVAILLALAAAWFNRSTLARMFPALPGFVP